MATIQKSTLFPAALEKEIFNAVRGKSALAALSQNEPIPFVGKDVFVFSMPGEVSVVGESQPKPAGDSAITSVPIRPVKVVYQSRVTAEFMYASEEQQLNTLSTFAEGFARKLAKGLDIMAGYGYDPATGAASAVIGNNNLSYAITNYASGANVVQYTTGTDDPVDKLEEAISKVDELNGIAMSADFREDIAGLKATSGGAQPAYPEFSFGGAPTQLGAANLAVSSGLDAADIYGIVGNFDAFRWGFAKEMPLEIIEYGNPDGGTYDLKRANEVLLRSEAFIGWGILNPADFAMVIKP
jgi:hypothetical protein